MHSVGTFNKVILQLGVSPYLQSGNRTPVVSVGVAKLSAHDSSNKPGLVSLLAPAHLPTYSVVTAFIAKHCSSTPPNNESRSTHVGNALK